jgi:oxygen-independent coproporphyrinogen-3 oxidase
LSLGVQALNEADLRFLGRTHNLTMARACLAEIVRIFDNHSADLIYARPQQNIASWQKELNEICSYDLRHISLYQLTIEEGTVFARKNIQALDEDEAAEMYDFTRDFLRDAGYLHYEVSNFARLGYESRHNLTYWQGGDYLGIGASAHGRIYLNGQHLATVYPFEHTALTAQERARELILMGLRLTEGLNKQRFKQICGRDFSECINLKHKQNLLELGLLEENHHFIRATYSGMLVLNAIISQLCDI